MSFTKTIQTIVGIELTSLTFYVSTEHMGSKEEKALTGVYPSIQTFIVAVIVPNGALCPENNPPRGSQMKL